MSFEIFTSVAENSRASVKIRRSKFIATAGRIRSEDDAKTFVSEVSAEFRNASHNCWACRIGSFELSSDAGEPSGTAGIPILGAIKACGADRIAIVVTRYFGGVKLGVRGLIDAYSRIARSALEAAESRRFFIGRLVSLDIEYPNFDRMAYAFRKSGYFYFAPPEFSQTVHLELFIPEEEKMDFPHEDKGILEVPENGIIRI